MTINSLNNLRTCELTNLQTTSHQSSIRVRFAPSPTGLLHIGGARTALYNYLFAKQNTGVFVLRIEDTDEERSTTESVNSIINGLKWLGITWDEGPEVGGQYGPYFQMERYKQEIYQKYVNQLLNSGHAYYCYCTPEELELQRADAMRRKIPPKYNGQCRELTPDECKQKEQNGRKSVVRFKTPKDGKTTFVDLIRGDVVFENGLIDDFVIRKTSGIPTFNFAVVIDDYLMKITHVLRGDDHISNTPRQMLVYQSLGFEVPNFAHFPMIHGSDGTRLSKRHGAVDVVEYKTKGYLPETMNNYLALLGWSTEDSQQIFSMKELIEKFNLNRCGKCSAKFDSEKLIWMNGVYIRNLNVDEIIKRIVDKESCIYDWAKEIGLADSDKKSEKYKYIKNLISAEHDKIKLLTDIPNLLNFFIKDITDLKLKMYDETAVSKVLQKSEVKEILADIYKLLEKHEDFSVQSLENVVRNYANEKKIKPGVVFHPLRVAVSGKTQGPGLFELLILLGKNIVLKRIEFCIKNLIK